MLLGCAVEVSEERAAGDGCAASDRVDPDLAHRREIDDDPVVARAMAGHAVAPAANRQRQAERSCARDRRGHVLGVVAAGNRRRATVDRAAPDAAGLLVADVSGRDQLAGESSPPELAAHVAGQGLNGHAGSFALGSQASADRGPRRVGETPYFDPGPLSESSPG
jgi:hypothetical protein